MTFLLSLGLLLAANAGATDPSSRCSLLAGEAPQQWLTKERIRPLPDQQPLIERVRARAWVPTMRISTDFSVDDDERLTLAETARTSDYRSSAITRGGRSFGVELALKWRLQQRFTSALELGIRRHQRQLQLDSRKASLALSDALRDWLLGLAKFCVSSSEERPVLYARLIGHEARLDHFSDGRFSAWIKEQIQ